jgi:hypothetical protein
MDTDRHTDRNGAHPDLHTHFNGHRHPHAHRHADRDGADPDPHADFDADGHADLDAHRHADLDAYRHGHGDPDEDANPYPRDAHHNRADAPPDRGCGRVRRLRGHPEVQ